MAPAFVPNYRPTKQNSPAGANPAGPSLSPGASAVKPRTYSNMATSKLHNRKLRLTHIAQRAAPILGDIGEARARGDTVLRQTFFLVIDPAANQADPAFVLNNNFAHDTLFLQFNATIHALCPFLGRAATRNITGI